ncbi:MAG: (Fe-S)-binding protein [Chitinophagaceae bacterium]|nr:(Fe-S)-binding protein [Chitinophagaceae bacterium]
MNVQLFIPCFIDQLYPDTAFNMVKVLEKAGCNVHYNTNQTCCGQPAFNAGYWDDSKKVCSKFIKDFSGSDVVVGPSGSCVGFVKNQYTKLFDNSSLHNDVKDLCGRIYEFTDFLVNVLKVEDFGAILEGKATYHDSCAALRECGVKKEPRKLLSNVKGLELIEMADSDTCCGFGGTFSVKFDPISIGMADTKVDNAIATGAKTMHIADVLACGW